MSEITADVCHRCLADLWDNRETMKANLDRVFDGEKSTDWVKDDAQDKLPTLQHCLNYHWYPKKHSSSLELPRCPGLREGTLHIFSTPCLFFFFLTWEPSHPAASQLNASDCSMVLFWRKSSGLEDQIESQKWRLSSSWWVYNWE